MLDNAVSQAMQGSVNSVAYSPSGAQLASGSYDNTVRLWEVSSGQCLRKIESLVRGIRSVAWQVLPEGEYLFTGSYDKLVCKWELKKEREGYKVKLDWMSVHDELTVNDTLIEEVIGLSEENYKLLNQRGAVFSENSVFNFFQRKIRNL